MLDAGSKIRRNRDATHKIFSRYLRANDPSALSLNYRLYVEPLQIYPTQTSTT